MNVTHIKNPRVVSITTQTTIFLLLSVLQQPANRGGNLGAENHREYSVLSKQT